MKLQNLVDLGRIFTLSATVCLLPGLAQAETIYAPTTDGLLISLDSATPGTVASAVAITGLQPGEAIVGLDFAGTTLYGAGNSSRLYSIDPLSGAASEIGQFSSVLNGLAFGFDTDATGARAIGSFGQHLVVDLNTGATTTGPNVSGAISGLAYDIGSGQYYVADYSANTIGTLDITTGGVTLLGPAGIDFSRNNGFDISQVTGTAFLATPATSSGAEANLYTINTSDGSATLVGLIGLSGDNILLQGMTVAVPEPTAAAFLLLGVGALLVVRRFRTQ
jgi:hypothetical protein